MSLSITTTYAGLAAANYISASLFNSKTLDGGYVNIMPNIKTTMKVPRGEFGNLMQAYARDFNDSGALTFTERTLTVTDLMVNYQLDIKQFEQMWDAEKQKAGAGNSEPSPTLADFILKKMIAKTAEQNEFNLWRGNFTGTTSELSGYTLYTGLLRQIDTANPNRVVGTTLSASNIVAELGKIYNSLLANVPQNENHKIVVSNAASGFYKQAVATASAEAYFVGDKQLNYLGIPIVNLPGMPTNIMVCYNPDNTWFGTDLTTDFNQVNIIDMRQTTADYKARYRADMKAGTQIGIDTEIVFYK